MFQVMCLHQCKTVDGAGNVGEPSAIDRVSRPRVRRIASCLIGLPNSRRGFVFDGPDPAPAARVDQRPDQLVLNRPLPLRRQIESL
ncbi:hypothetical protein Enr13x_31470 [Stieleria neptunia]|uniref:Uncharacterized protein n=1 Tax=Stieleria neptunia TaxID=2527979 RepID=A0A518HR10_9BACT|nr:hypothetical protein Enr13x_31470 [Stieleria neptunia]